MQLAYELSRRSAALRFEDLPAQAVHCAKVGILDTVGVTVAGSVEPAAQILGRVVAPTAGASLVFGSADRTSALDAALINGTAAHALDFDDCNNTLGGHPSAPILPALFALADERPVDGRAFIAAYVAGFETECKLGLGVNFHHYNKGWHPTATLGVHGAAAAACHLLHLDARRTATALAIASSLACGIKANFGTMTKPLHLGHCARSGLFAALLAEGDFTANAGEFEHNQGFLDVFNGPGNYDTARVLAHWGEPFDIVEPGIAIKQYPCCGSTHPALDVMLDLVRRHDLRAEKIARIECWTHARRLEHTNRPDPQSGLEAKFSVQYCLARALANRAIRIEHFEADAFRDPAVRAILPRVHAAAYTTTQFPADNHFGAEVKLTTRDGKTVSGKIDEAAGRTGANPLPAERLREKFENCIGRALPVARAAVLAGMIEQLDTLADMRSLSTLLSGAPAAPVRTERALAPTA
jgi:2-methylcitrate dehydratase PrpD